MSENGKQEKQCGNKIKYWTRGNAKLDCKRMGKKKGEKFQVYKCPFCEHFHIGHKLLGARNSVATEGV